MPWLDRPPGQQGFSRAQYFGQVAAPNAGATQVRKVVAMNLPANPEQASMQSLEYIHALAREGREDPRARGKALEIVRAAGVTDGRQYSQVIRAIFDWIQHNVFYVHDPTGVELLTTPGVLVEQADAGVAAEDCDSFVALAHALFNSLGVPTRSVIWKADRRAPDQWSHITLEVFDAGAKRWIHLDPIMKDKPLGWAPPRFYAKRIVPVGDGEPWPAHLQRATRAVPKGQTMAGFFRGASNAVTWRGFSGYGANAPAYDITEAGPRYAELYAQAKAGVDCVHAPTGMQLGNAPSPLEPWATAYIVKVMTDYGVRLQNMEPAAWVAHIRGWMGSQLDARGWLLRTDRTQDFHWAEQLLRTTGGYIAKQSAEAGARVIAAADRLAECFDQHDTWAQTFTPEYERATAIGEVQQMIRQMRIMRNEAISYVQPLIEAAPPLIERAERAGERIKDKAKQLKLVNDVVGYVGIVLSALGPATAGITEIANVAIQLGNLAYQYDQAASLASSNAATTLKNVAEGLRALEQHIDAAVEIAQHADAEIAKYSTMLYEVRAKYPQYFAPAVAPTAEAALASALGIEQPRTALVVGLIAAAAAIAMVAVL